VTTPVVINAQDPARFDHAYIQRMIAGGVTASLVNVGVYNPWTMRTRDLGDALHITARWYGTIREHSELRLARTVQDLDAAADAKGVALIMGFQGLDPIDSDPDLLDVFWALGLRVAQLTYNEPNQLGDGCFEPRNGGLTEQGRRYVERLNALGIVIDLSHVGERTAREAIDASADPVIFSHSNARAEYDNPRNLSDATIKAVAERGGIIGISMFPPMVTKGQMTLPDMAAHGRHIADLVGAEHVGLGLDYPESFGEAEWAWLYADLGFDTSVLGPPPPLYPTALQGIQDFPLILDAFRETGFSDTEVAGIAGGNLRSLFEPIWREDKMG